jgi:hypothetical protein
LTILKEWVGGGGREDVLDMYGGKTPSAKASTVIVAASLFGLFRILSNPLCLREGFQGSQMEKLLWLDSVRLNMDVVGPWDIMRRRR